MPLNPRAFFHSTRAARRPERSNSTAGRHTSTEHTRVSAQSDPHNRLDLADMKHLGAVQLEDPSQDDAKNDKQRYPPDKATTRTSNGIQEATSPQGSSRILRIQQLSNQLIDSLTRIAHRLNMYTGTDYTPIQTLRNSIRAQENQLRQHHEDVAAAKSSHGVALKFQRTHQKEVVQLLERKHSWSDADMERYMGLIRSEHVNEREADGAARDVVRAERSLEAARQELERSERKMYHEEQVWSDTIRRNSTWITFGLMGLNVVLLLFQIGIMEPWRRKRLIKEMRTALDEKTLAAPATIPTHVHESVAEAAKTVAEVDEAVTEPAPPTALALSEPSTTPEEVGKEPSRGSAIPRDDELDELPSTSLPKEAFAHLAPHPFTSLEALRSPASWRGVLEHWGIVFKDLFSDRVILLRKIDLTSDRFSSAALGVMLGGVALVVGMLTID